MKLIFYLLSGLYGLVVLIRNMLYDLKILKSVEFDIPVIAVGNITAGGTGKTPHIEYLIQLLKPEHEVATLSRGYKRKTKGFRLAMVNSSVKDCGDEPLQLKQKFNEITVAVCENRVAGVRELLRLADPPDVVLLDDAFQHRRITPGINILLVDYSRPIREDNLLPAGRLREGKIQVRRANIVIVTKCPGEVTPMYRKVLKKNMDIRPYQSLFFTTLGYGLLIPVFADAHPDVPLSGLKQAGVLVVTGIASPQTMLDYLSGISRETDSVCFPDHYYYKQADIRLILNKFEMLTSVKKIIVTTEKDAVRFRELSNLPAEIKFSLYSLPVSIRFLENGEEFEKRIISYVGKNKRNSRLHKIEDKL